MPNCSLITYSPKGSLTPLEIVLWERSKFLGSKAAAVSMELKTSKDSSLTSPEDGIDCIPCISSRRPLVPRAWEVAVSLALEALGNLVRIDSIVACDSWPPSMSRGPFFCPSGFTIWLKTFCWPSSNLGLKPRLSSKAIGCCPQVVVMVVPTRIRWVPTRTALADNRGHPPLILEAADSNGSY